MAIYTHLPIYKATYTLMLEVCRMMPDMPRDCRYSLGQDTRKKIMEMIILIYHANRTKGKVPLILKMREVLQEVQVYVRLMSDMRYVSEGKYLRLAEQMTAISKQLSAWEKSERQKHSDGLSEKA